MNKLDALLTFSGLEDIKYGSGAPWSAPRGRFPFIELNGTIVPDSELAYNTCIANGLVNCLDQKAGLNEKESATSIALRALVEQLGEMMVYERYATNCYWLYHSLHVDGSTTGTLPGTHSLWSSQHLFALPSRIYLFTVRLDDSSPQLMMTYYGILPPRQIRAHGTQEPHNILPKSETKPSKTKLAPWPHLSQSQAILWARPPQRASMP